VGGGRARKQGRVASVNTSASVAATKKGDLEVRKDLTIESQRAEIFFPTADTAAATTSRPSTSSVVTRAKVGEAHHHQRDGRNTNNIVPARFDLLRKSTVPIIIDLFHQWF
jgi:hypothetical protein